MAKFDAGILFLNTKTISDFALDLSTCNFINVQMMIVRAIDQLALSSLKSFISHSQTQDHLKQGSSGSAALRLTAKQVEEMDVSIPPMEKQKEYTVKLSAIRSLKAICLSSERKLSGNFNPLQHRAFQGRI